MEERKRLVLKAIVDHYIKTGQPVSSKTLLEEYGLPVSSATIRNDMMSLEKQGLIRKEYSSAGRVPTERGYRFFVDWLLELSELLRLDTHALVESFRFQRTQIDDLLRQTAFLLTSLSNYVGFVLAPRLEDTRLESIFLVKLDPESVLVVIVSELGIIEHGLIRSSIPEEELQEISALLNKKLRGMSLRQAWSEALKWVESEDWYDPVVRDAFLILKKALEHRMERRLHVEGLMRLLPLLLEEGQDLEEAIQILKVLGDAYRLGPYLESEATPKVRALIGSENALPDLKPCSLVLMSYGFSGVLGLVGPVRMDYSRAFSVTQYLGSRLQAILTLSPRR